MRHTDTHSASTLIDDLAYRFVLASLSGFGLVLLVSALYVTKSAMGIDLMDGPSPLHGVFFN